MELRQLDYFVAVARHHSFTRAAEQLHVAQPGVSQQIRRLEADIGETLFDRSTTPVRLTTAGQVLLPHARAVLDAINDGRSAIAQLNGILTGRLRLGIIPGIPKVDVAGLLVAFHERHPRVEVTLGEEHPVPLIEHLRRGDYDAAIIGLSHPHPPDGLATLALGAEDLVLVTSPTHRLAQAPVASVAELRDEAFVTLTHGSSLRDHVDDACDSAGFRARIALETSDVYRLGELVGRGLGVTILPHSVAAVAATQQPLRLIAIDPPLTLRHVALAWRTDKTPTPAASAFLDTASQILAPTHQTD